MSFRKKITYYCNFIKRHVSYIHGIFVCFLKWYFDEIFVKSPQLFSQNLCSSLSFFSEITETSYKHVFIVIMLKRQYFGVFCKHSRYVLTIFWKLHLVPLSGGVYICQFLTLNERARSNTSATLDNINIASNKLT